MASDLIRTHVSPRVEVRKRWSDPWQVRDDIYCLSCEFALGSIGSASFIRFYGDTMAQGETAFVETGPDDLAKYWIRVRIDPTDSSQTAKWWYGVIVADSLEIFGASDSPHNGNQRFQAFTPEYLLSRVQVFDTIATDQKLFSDGIKNRYRTAASFNNFKSDRSGERLKSGNKDSVRDYFAEDLHDAVDWTAKDILRYLINTVMKDASTNVTWTPNMDEAMNFTPLVVPVDGRTVYDILNSLFHYRRGLSWHVEPLDSGAGFRVKVRSIADQSLQLTNGIAVVKASPIKSIDVGSRNDVAKCMLQTTATTKYDQVVVEGGPVGAVFTVSIEALTLIDDWNQEDERKYRRGSADDAGYKSLGYVEKMEKNDAVRKSAELSHVFTRYRIAPGFNNVIAFSTDSVVFAKADENATADALTLGEDSLWDAAMRIQPYLPLKVNVNYAEIGDVEIDNNEPEVLPDFRKPIVFGMPNGQSRVYELVKQGHSSLDNEAAAFYFTAHLEPHQHQLGFSIWPTLLPHCLQNTWKYDDSSVVVGVSHVQAGKTGPQVDQNSGFIHHDTLGATVYARSSNNVRVKYPESIPIVNDDVPSILVIRLGDVARLDILAKNTIVDIGKDGAVKTPNAKVLRDDRRKMLRIALHAYEWHKKSRATLSLSLKSIDLGCSIGDLIERLIIGRPTTIKTQRNTIVSTDNGSTATVTTRHMLVTQSGVPLATSTGELLATHVVDVVPGTSNPGPRIAKQSDVFRYVNTVVSRVLYDFESFTTQLDTQFGELNLAGAFGDE